MVKVDVLRYPTEYDWELCKLCAITTLGLRKVVDKPDDEWKRRMLRARHTPIRSLHFLIRLDEVPSFVATHLARHVHMQPYIQTKRNDLQPDQHAGRETPVIMVVDTNAEELMAIANKRLCGKAHERTREVVMDMSRAVIETNPEFKPFLVPFCMEYGCHEFEPCGDQERYLP